METVGMSLCTVSNIWSSHKKQFLLDHQSLGEMNLFRSEVGDHIETEVKVSNQRPMCQTKQNIVHSMFYV